MCDHKNELEGPDSKRLKTAAKRFEPEALAVHINPGGRHYVPNSVAVVASHAEVYFLAMAHFTIQVNKYDCAAIQTQEPMAIDEPKVSLALSPLGLGFARAAANTLFKEFAEKGGAKPI